MNQLPTSIDSVNVPNDWMIALEPYEVAPGMINFRYRAYRVRPVPAEHRVEGEPAVAWQRTDMFSLDDHALRIRLWNLVEGGA